MIYSSRKFCYSTVDYSSTELCVVHSDTAYGTHKWMPITLKLECDMRNKEPSSSVKSVSLHPYLVIKFQSMGIQIPK